VTLSLIIPHYKMHHCLQCKETKQRSPNNINFKYTAPSWKNYNYNEVYHLLLAGHKETK